jgi:RNA polymerase sigma factor (sigma-70 family)
MDRQHRETAEENERLIASATRSREADRRLAVALRREEPAGPAATVGYLDDLGRRSRLDPDAERALVAAARAGDATARARLVEAFMPLIASVARVYRETREVERVELLQEGVVGLLRAIERYDPDRGVPFWGYATFWVRQAMQQLVAELTRPLVLSDRALRHLSHVKEAHRRAVQESGREPATDELATRAGLTVEQVESVLAADRTARSTDEPVEADDGAVGRFGDLLVDPLAHDEYERVLDAIEVQELLSLLAGLSDRERDVLSARYGLDGEEQSLRQVGERLGLSAERVRQLEGRALGKLAAGARREPRVDDRPSAAYSTE